MSVMTSYDDFEAIIPACKSTYHQHSGQEDKEVKKDDTQRPGREVELGHVLLGGPPGDSAVDVASDRESGGDCVADHVGQDNCETLSEKKKGRWQRQSKTRNVDGIRDGWENK